MYSRCLYIGVCTCPHRGARVSNGVNTAYLKDINIETCKLAFYAHELPRNFDDQPTRFEAPRLGGLLGMPRYQDYEYCQNDFVVMNIRDSFDREVPAKRNP
jgi:hypothetical protein